MPWCPKCNMEYREGIKECADCGTELVDDAVENQTNEVELVRLETEENTQKLIDFLHYSKIEQISYSYDEKDQAYVVMVEESTLKEAKKLFNAFYTAETEDKEESLKDKTDNSELADSSELDNEEDSYENDNNNSSLNDLRDNSKATPLYVKKAEKFKDLRSSGYTFIGVGIAGFVFLILNILGIFSFYQGFSQIVIGIVFAIFIVIGISTLRSSNQVKGQIDDENNLTDAINSWLQKTITQELLNTVTDPEEADEINYFKQTEYVKNAILEEFSKDLDDSYVDLLVEEFFNNYFSS